MNVVQLAADRFIRWAFSVDPHAWPYSWIVYAAFILLDLAAALRAPGGPRDRLRILRPLRR